MWARHILDIRDLITALPYTSCLDNSAIKMEQSTGDNKVNPSSSLAFYANLVTGVYITVVYAPNPEVSTHGKIHGWLILPQTLI